MEEIVKIMEDLGGVRKNPRNTSNIAEFDFDKSVRELESIYGNKIPDYYVRLQSLYGGFCFQNSVMVKAIEDNPSLTEDKSVSLNYFYGFEFEGDNSIYKWIRNYQGRIPSSFLPICGGWLNNLICIDLGRVNYGKIYFWLSDTLEGEQEYFLLANDLKTMLSDAFVKEIDDSKDEERTDFIDEEKFKRMNPKLQEMMIKSGRAPKSSGTSNDKQNT